jgi:hypothetical protein
METIFFTGFRMQKIKQFGVITTVIFLTGISSGFAEDAAILNQQAVINTLKNQSSLPVLFPAKISRPGAQKLYLSASSYGINPDYQKFWQLNIDATPTCQGTKVCNIGFISAEKNGQLDLYYSTLPENKNHLKQRVKLKNNITGYYTPFHIQAGGVNPTLEWQVNHVLYTLTWRIQAEPAQQKQTLVEMANSAIP